MPEEVRAHIKAIGILNNAYFEDFVPECVALKKYPNLLYLDYVPRRGGITDQVALGETIEEMRRYAMDDMIEDHEGPMVGRTAGAVNMAEA
jgi:hypothetical protein